MVWLEVILVLLCARLRSSLAATTSGCCSGTYSTCSNAADSTGCQRNQQFTAGYTCVLSSGKCVQSTTVTTDPILRTFDNQTIEINGVPGRNYSLLSGPSFHLNMQLVAAGEAHIRHQGGEGTFVGGLAALLPSQGHSLVTYVDEAGNMTFSLDGEAVTIEEPATFYEGLLSYEPYAPELGQVLTLRAEPFIVQIVAVKRFTDSISGYNRGHLDLRVELTSAPTLPLTGILWTTLSSPFQQALTALEEVQYEVAFLDHPPAAAHVQTFTRRLMAENEVAYPAFASLK